MADQARLRRDAKYHAVLEEPLSLPATTPDGTPYENLTAAQISSMVQAGSLDAADLARFLAHRCAKYGRSYWATYVYCKRVLNKYNGVMWKIAKNC